MATADMLAHETRSRRVSEAARREQLRQLVSSVTGDLLCGIQNVERNCADGAGQTLVQTSGVADVSSSHSIVESRRRVFHGPTAAESDPSRGISGCR
jgi:hypothetical protein